MTTKEMSHFLNSLWCWARCTEEEQRKLSEIADYLSSRGNEKNDCISRKAVLDAIDAKAWEFCVYLISEGRNDELKPVSLFADNLRECVREELPSVTLQEPQSFKWCTDCKEYDTEKQCCHRYSKVIRDTVAGIGQEPVLDNIRSDIKAYTDSQGFINISEYRFNEILDKYKAGREK